MAARVAEASKLPKKAMGSDLMKAYQMAAGSPDQRVQIPDSTLQMLIDRQEKQNLAMERRNDRLEAVLQTANEVLDLAMFECLRGQVETALLQESLNHLSTHMDNRPFPKCFQCVASHVMNCLDDDQYRFILPADIVKAMLQQPISAPPQHTPQTCPTPTMPRSPSVPIPPVTHATPQQPAPPSRRFYQHCE